MTTCHGGEKKLIAVGDSPSLLLLLRLLNFIITLLAILLGKENIIAANTKYKGATCFIESHRDLSWHKLRFLRLLNN